MWKNLKIKILLFISKVRGYLCTEYIRNNPNLYIYFTIILKLRLKSKKYPMMIPWWLQDDSAMWLLPRGGLI